MFPQRWLSFPKQEIQDVYSLVLTTNSEALSEPASESTPVKFPYKVCYMLLCVTVIKYNNLKNLKNIYKLVLLVTFPNLDYQLDFRLLFANAFLQNFQALSMIVYQVIDPERAERIIIML